MGLSFFKVGFWAIILCGFVMLICHFRRPVVKGEVATLAEGLNPSLLPLVRNNWAYLLGAPIFGPYICFVSPTYGLPQALDYVVLLASLCLAMVPVIRRKALPMFWFLSLVIWLAGVIVAAWLMAATGYVVPGR